MGFKSFIIIFIVLFMAGPVLVSIYMGFPTIKIFSYATIYSYPKESRCYDECSGEKFEISCYTRNNKDSCNYLCKGSYKIVCPTYR